MITTQAFRLGAFEVEPSRNLLIRDGVQHTVEPRLMEVLCALAERGEEVVSRQRLIDQIWSVEFGADEGLTRAVSALRRVIREAGEAEAYIETIPKRGYRLLKPVEPMGDVPPTRRPSVGDGANPSLAFPSRGMLAAMPILLFALAMFAWVSFRTEPEGSAAEATSEKRQAVSIAVLPFRPFSEEPADLHFGDGVAEELLHLLARVPDMQVAARTSSFSFRDETVTATKIGEALSVDYILEGSVRRSGERIRITAQLIRTADGFHLWSQTFDRELADVFAVQDEITRHIASALQMRLGSQFSGNLGVSPDADPRAIELFYEALYQWSNRLQGEDGMHKPFDTLRAAVRIDEDFAPAWGALGYFGTLAYGGPVANDREAHADMTTAALHRALRLDPQQVLAHVGLALWHMQNEIDLEKAAYHVARATELSPNALTTLSARGFEAWLLGNPEEALQIFSQMRRMDPLNQIVDLQYALLLAQIGVFDEAFQIFDTCRRTRCAEAGFVPYATTAAYLSQDQAIMERWEPIAFEFLTVLERVPESKKPQSTKLLPALFADWFDRPDKEEKMEEALQILEADPITDGIGLWGPTIARTAPPELMIGLLNLASEKGDLVSAPYALSPFYGFHPYPAELLASPGYAAFFEKEGLAQLANARRLAGYTDGLPTP